jgi:hypothetical protein
MSDLQGRKVFKVFNQEFIVDERYNVTKELGQGAYGIVCAATNNTTGEGVAIKKVFETISHPWGLGQALTCHKGYQCLQQEDSSQASFARDQVAPAFQR